MICVSAICKNEEKFITRFLDHVKHADWICLVDTGSTDKTLELIEDWHKHNSNVRLDLLLDDGPRNLGRSRSLASSMFPDTATIIWLDIDEYFSDPNWVETLRDVPTPIYIEMHNGTSHYFQCKGYRKDQHVWMYRAHEVLTERNTIQHAPTYIESFHTEHTPDRSKVRNYLPELAQDATQFPHDDRASFYYCRELCYDVIYNGGSLEEAEAEYRRLLSLDTWKDYKALASIELMTAQQVCDKIDMSVIYTAMASRPDRVEVFSQSSYILYQAGDYVTSLSFAIQGIARAEMESKFLFSAVPTNLNTCLDCARYACLRLGMHEQAAYYNGLYSMRTGEDHNKWLEDNNLFKVSANGEDKTLDA